MDYYKKIMDVLSCYFAGKEWKKLFLSGGCYWLANVLHQGIRDSIVMINRVEEHCALYFERGLYDVKGKIPMKNFHVATDREISFMRKNYIPSFETKTLERYLETMLNDN